MKTLLKCNLPIFLLVLTLASCTSEPDFSGLCGEWIMADKNIKQIETWNCTDAGARGEGYRIMGSDTLFSEKFSLAHFDALGWVLNVSVKGQNQDAYIPFVLTKWDDGMLEFSNSNHDFPTRITYTWNSADKLKGVADDGEHGVKQVEFNYERASEVR